MFKNFFDTIIAYLGLDFLTGLLWTSLIVAGAAVLALLVTGLIASRKDDGARAVGKTLDVVTALAKMFVGIVVTALLIISLKGRQADFDHLYGRVTETNYEAVQSIWGSPHNQYNLDVKHFVEEEEIIEQIRSEDARMAAEGIPGEVERTFRRKVRKEIPQDSIIQNDLKVVIKMNYRKKGSAFYTTYDDEVEFKYVVENRADKITTAEFTFALPVSQGMVRNFQVFVDDKDLSDVVTVENSKIKWELQMEAGARKNIRISYISRGMDYWAFRVRDMEALRNFRLQIIVPNYHVENNPMGCMTPTSVKHDEQGTILEWALDRAVSSLGMGIILPERPQPGHYESKLLREAPTALFLFVALIVITRLLLGTKLALTPVMLLAFAHERFYALLAYFCTLNLPIWASLFIASVLLIGATAWFLSKYGDRKNAVRLQTGFFALLTLGFSLCVIESEHTPLLLQILYALLLVIVMVMAVGARRNEERE